MPLNIETFSNAVGGNAFYKAIAHPLTASLAAKLLADLQAHAPVAIFDPKGFASAFDTLYPLYNVPLAGVFVQNVEEAGRRILGQAAKPVNALAAGGFGAILIADFDTADTEARIRSLYSPDVPVFSFDQIRLSGDMLTDARRYLSTLNFATNFVFFRDEGGQHTRLVTVNYWGSYGAKSGFLRLMLFAGDGGLLADWREALPPAGAIITIDSADICRRFSLPAFTGQLFVHVVGAAGHDIVKYALDTYGDAPGTLSATHDANSWPSNLYAGLPAPDAGEEVVLWVQNSHPVEIAAGEIGLTLMGHDNPAFVGRAIAPFATYRLSAAELLPKAHWPQQIEIRAGKHLVRPRYEVIREDGRRNIAHPNVEREDLKLDPKLATLGPVLGKGFILPAPILPPDRYTSLVLPTPMSTVQQRLPVKLVLYDANGAQIAEHAFGNLKRSESIAIDVADVLGNHALTSGYGHMELAYDFEAGDEADGWLHALFRYIDRKSGHRAETSFGAHVFNTLATYKNEPQSYKGPPPGLSTRLFLRVGPKPYETLCHLIYPASLPWHSASDTTLLLMSGNGREIARHALAIPCGGSVLWRAHEVFSQKDFGAAGDGAYVVIRDTTCRLFGYHGLVQGDDAFSFDHMFGF
jgi:hypothetical protein